MTRLQHHEYAHGKPFYLLKVVVPSVLRSMSCSRSVGLGTMRVVSIPWPGAALGSGTGSIGQVYGQRWGKRVME
jgi:hypothetical protein